MRKNLRKELVKATEIYRDWKYWKWGKIFCSKYSFVIPGLIWLLAWYFLPHYTKEIILLVWLLFGITSYINGEMSGYIDWYGDGITKDSGTFEEY
jgi:hypothetical protein